MSHSMRIVQGSLVPLEHLQLRLLLSNFLLSSHSCCLQLLYLGTLNTFFLLHSHQLLLLHLGSLLLLLEALLQCAFLGLHFLCFSLGLSSLLSKLIILIFEIRLELLELVTTFGFENRSEMNLSSSFVFVHQIEP